MDYSKISKVVDLYRVDEVNDYLKIGWIIADIYNKAYDTEYPGINHQTAHYVLVWTAEGEPQYPKPDFDLSKYSI